MADWSLMEREWQLNQYDPYQYYDQCYQRLPRQPCMQQQLMPPPPPPAQSYHSSYPSLLTDPSTSQLQQYNTVPPKPDNPREIRNKAEKQRRDKLNQSISQLASMVPPVVAASRKIDKTGVLRLTAHYLRAHQYVFGDSVNREDQQQFSAKSTRALLSILNGFLLTTTYRGLIVVVSQNVQQYLGYSELDLLGQNIFNIIHEDDRQLMRDMLMPKAQLLGPNGELLVPDEPEGKNKLSEELSTDKRRFIIRFKKLSPRSEPSQYVTCHVEGSLRKSDRACRGYNRCCQMVRRARARSDNPCNSGNDVVFVGIVRMAAETFITESHMESCRMEYRTRHSVDGQIIQCERRISLVTGYMTHEVNGVNAMNFMHRDDVRWVVIALREMYDQHRLFGESCYRLLTKNGQFIYMRTRGRLDVDPSTREVTSFVCTNTVVDEQEGKQLIKIMKKKFTLLVNNNEEPVQEEENGDDEEDESKDTNDQNVSVEDPRQLEKVILHLVTNLPSPPPTEDNHGHSPDRTTPSGRLAIIPPKKENIVSAIEKIYSVINTLPKNAERVSKPPTAEELSSPSGMLENDLTMNFNMQSTSHSSRFSVETQKVSSDTLYEDHPSSTLPNLSNLYHQSSEGNKDLEYGMPMASSGPNDDNNMMAQIAVEPSTSYSNSVITFGNTIHANCTKSSGDYNKNVITLGHTMNSNVANIKGQYNGHVMTFESTANSKCKNANGEYSENTVTFRNTMSSNYTNICVEYNGNSFSYDPIVSNSNEERYDEANTLFGLNKPTNITSGVKRQRDCPEYTEVEATYKKKSAEDNKMNDGTILDDIPLLDSFFEESLFNSSFTRIDPATLEHNMDPFPELLVSQEVQEILREIEDAPVQSGLQSGF